MVAAILAVIGSLAGVALGQYLAGRNQDKLLQHQAEEKAADRHHAIQLRELELREEHRANLRGQRLDAYRQFAAAHRSRRRADEEFDRAFARRQYVLSQDPAAPEDFDAAVQAWTDASNRSVEARTEVEDVAAMVALVASSEVRDAVGRVHEAASHLAATQTRFWGNNGWGNTDPDEWLAVMAAKRELDDREEALLDAISRELELDR